MQVALRLSGYLHAVKYRLYHALRRRPGLNTQRREYTVVVSLTSHPPRLNSAFLAVESLLDQSFRPDRVVLWLSGAELAAQDVPASLRKLEARGLEIRWVDENLKCYKKLVHAVEAFGACHIVTADDDFMFPRHWLRDLYRAHRRHPDCIAAYRGYVMSRNGERQLRPYNVWPAADSVTGDPAGPSFDVFPTYGAGAWFPPQSLHARVADPERLFMRLCPTADDIWYKAMSLLARTPAVMVRPRSVTFPMIYLRGAQQVALWKINERANDATLKAVFEHFDLYPLVSLVDVRRGGDAARAESEQSHFYNINRPGKRRRKRVFDIALSIICLPVLIAPMLLIAALIKATSRGGVLYWSRRVGRDGVIFNMPKFRTLKPVPAAAQSPPERRQYALFGKFLRYASLDELPQLFSILKGDMSFVGPRPIESVEAGLISLRAEKEVDTLTPGITGWAQVNGRDLLSDAEKVNFDLQYMSRQTLWLDIKILLITFAQVLRRENISF